jgi:chemotaxis response regulator CheB
MRELVMATIADQPDIEVVGEVQNESDLADIVEQAEPDVLIIAKAVLEMQAWDGRLVSHHTLE